MSTGMVGLAILMALATYPFRALPLIVPGVDRLPRLAVLYLRLVGPAILASLAATSVALTETSTGGFGLHPGIEWAAVALSAALVAWRRNPLIGVAAAVALTVLGRAAMAS
jgi:branched-subunit amino acid transport protein